MLVKARLIKLGALAFLRIIPKSTSTMRKKNHLLQETKTHIEQYEEVKQKEESGASIMFGFVTSSTLSSNNFLSQCTCQG